MIIGFFLGCAVTRLIQHQLWGIKPTDPWTLGTVAGLVLSIGLFACMGPARRATEVDPYFALREEQELALAIRNSDFP